MQRAWGQWGVAWLQGRPVVQLISPAVAEVNGVISIMLHMKIHMI